MHLFRLGPYSLFLVVIFVIVSQQQVLGQRDTSATFSYPVEDQHGGRRPVFNYLDVVNASWSSTWPAPWLHLWCTANEALSGDQTELYNEAVSAAASRLVALDYGNAFNRCHFELTPDQNTGRGVNSPNFNILKDPDRKPVTWSLSSTTAITNSENDDDNTESLTPTTSPSPPASTSSPSVSSTTLAQKMPPRNGLSSAGAVGIGIGCGVVGLALLAGAYYLGWKKRSRMKFGDRTATENRWKGRFFPSEKLYISELESSAGSEGLGLGLAELGHNQSFVTCNEDFDRPPSLAGTGNHELDGSTGGDRQSDCK